MHPIRLLLIVVLLHAGLIAFAQPAGKEQQIKQIRREYQAINSNKALRKVTLNNEEFLDELPDGGGQLTGYYAGSELRKMVSWIGLSNGTQLFEYYYQAGRLIFVYEQFSSFYYDQQHDNLRTDSLERTFEGRYYFAGNQLIDYRTTGHNRFEDDALDPEKILMAEAEAYRKKLRRK